MNLKEIGLRHFFTPNAIPASLGGTRREGRGCGTCTFWTAETDVSGYCLRLQPQVVALPPMSKAGHAQLNAVTCWPLTLADHWCGEHATVATAA